MKIRHLTYRRHPVRDDARRAREEERGAGKVGEVLEKVPVGNSSNFAHCGPPPPPRRMGLVDLFQSQLRVMLYNKWSSELTFDSFCL